MGRGAKNIDVATAVHLVEGLIEDPTKGLPEEVFLFLSRIAPLVNVDLLIKDKKGRTLLTWRVDNYGPPGWHIPGGIIRFRELAGTRINAVAASELGAKVSFKDPPLMITEIILPQRNRAHGISLLYECRMESPPDPGLKYKQGTPKSGEWAWHKGCPDNLLKVHEMYRRFL